MHSKPQRAIPPSQPHLPLVQVEKAAPQSVGTRQATQVFEPGSQKAFGFAHCVSFSQPTMQVFVVALHFPLGQSPGSTQPTQAWVVGSQKAAFGSEQLPSPRHCTHFWADLSQ
jgi:hypothetical protein